MNIAVNVRDPYLIPGVDECMDSLGDITVFPILNAKGGYWVVEVADGCCRITKALLLYPIRVYSVSLECYLF